MRFSIAVIAITGVVFFGGVALIMNLAAEPSTRIFAILAVPLHVAALAGVAYFISNFVEKSPRMKKIREEAGMNWLDLD
ncbi:hypothetical protein [Streptosporangium sp. NPDC051022]|uniref:hypothetical protein n=1 Tax=Streptosporangium sp. NPDC051022 TaxID=3155752 RepID=UPI00341EE193